MTRAVSIQAGFARALPSREVLASIGLHPWSDDGISAYMAKQKAEHPANIWYYIGRPAQTVTHFISVLCYGVVALFAAVFLLACLAAVVGAVFGWQNAVPPLWGFAGLAVAICIAVAAGMKADDAYNWLFTKAKVREPGRWDLVDLADHTGEEPASLDSIVRRTRGLFPGTRFKVGEFRQDERLLDPILWAELDGDDGVTESIALLVWDEHGNIVLPR